MMSKLTILAIFICFSANSYAQIRTEEEQNQDMQVMSQNVRFTIRFNYDNVGMITNLIPIRPTSRESDISISQEANFRLSLRANANTTWSSVRVQTNIDLSGASQNSTMRIYTASGNLVASYNITQTSTILDLSDLDKGVYIFTLYNGEDQVSYKLYKRQ